MMMDLKSLVRTIPDFPKPGIQFRDITTLLIDGPGFAEAVDRLVALARPYGADLVAVLVEHFLEVRPCASLPCHRHSWVWPLPAS